MIRRLFFILAFLLLVHTATARDERSIKDLSKALAGLARDVDPAEAELVSVTAHTTARKLAKDYRVVLNPEFTVFLVNVGMRFVQCLDRSQQAAALLFHVDVRMVVDILFVIGRGMPYLIHRRIDLLNGNVFARVNPPVARLVRQKPTRRVQIRERMLIERMPAG